MQFGCGTTNPASFDNYDSSLNLYLQRHWVTKLFTRSKVVYPHGVVYGDIVRGLPYEPQSLKGIYSSHVIEHLAYNDCRRAIVNSFGYLEDGGIFRCVLPNLEAQVGDYLKLKSTGDVDAANKFMRYTFLGYENRPGNLRSLVRWYLATDMHLWMWDAESLMAELKAAGFSKVYRSGFNQSVDPVFNEAEHPGRFEWEALCIEAVK